MLGEPRSSLLERALEALPAAPARGAHGLALPPLDELVDFDRSGLEERPVAPQGAQVEGLVRPLKGRGHRSPKSTCRLAWPSSPHDADSGQRERAARLAVALGAVACSPPELTVHDALPERVVPEQLVIRLPEVEGADVRHQRVRPGRLRVREDPRVEVEVVVGSASWMSPAPQQVTDSSSITSRPTFGASAWVEVSSSLAYSDARQPL